MKRKLILFIILLTVCLGVYGVDSIRITKIDTSIAAGISKTDLDDFINDAIDYANSRYGEYIKISRGSGSGAQYTLELQPTYGSGNVMIMINLKQKSSGKLSPGKIFSGILDDDNVKFLAGSIFHQWASFKNYFQQGITEKPMVVDEYPTSLFDFGYYHPLSIAVRSNDNIIFGLGSRIQEYSKSFEYVASYGDDLVQKGVTNFSSLIYVTASDILYSRASTGSLLYKYIQGYPRTQQIPIQHTFLGSAGEFAFFNDGSFLVADLYNRKITHIKEDEKKEIETNNSMVSGIGGVYSDYAGNIWIFDSVQQRFKICSSEGVMLDSVQLIAPPEAYLTVSTVNFFKDGSIIIHDGKSKLYAFNKTGILLWSLDVFPPPINSAMPLYISCAVNSSTGVIYILDVIGKRIYSIIDAAYLDRNDIESPFYRRIADLQQKLAKNPQDIGSLKNLAELWENNENYAMAAEYYDKILAIDPFDFDAEDNFNNFRSQSLKVKAARLHSETEKLLFSLGVENAREKYTELIKMYEQILALTPGDSEIKNNKTRIEQQFLQRSANPDMKNYPKITITSFSIDDLFPSMMSGYTSNPLGKLEIKTPADYRIENLEISFKIPGYMDLPWTITPNSSPEKNKSVSYSLYGIFNSKFLGNQENIDAAAEIEINYTIESAEQFVSKLTGVKINRNTALSWDDSAKLASFITPNEQNVQTFALKSVSSASSEGKEGIPEKILYAAAIIDSMGIHDIKYIQDPDFPISSALGNKSVIDIVRFPRTTLYVRTGDCDDTTALLCSLLEAAGIETAIMTSPGHVFLAFNTEEPSENKWMFDAESLNTIIHEKEIWMPIESTVTSGGFMKAWEYASKIIDKEDEIEFIPVKTKRDLYPPIPLPESPLDIIPPSAQETETKTEESMDDVYDVLYTQGIKSLENKISSAGSRFENRFRNQLAAFHARFGKTSEAEKILNDILGKDPSYKAAYLNLANVYISEDNINKAVDTLKLGLKLDPDSVLLNMTLSQCYLTLNKRYDAEKYYSIAVDQSPDLALSFGYLFEDSSARAGADFEIVPFWDSGEE